MAAVASDELLPADYLYVNHTSFFRPGIQAEMQAKTGHRRLKHYDIQVIVDSYYEGALDRVDRVEYILHEEYDEPLRMRRDKNDRFLLKEIANGEYVLLARVYLKNIPAPLLLQRYITLWDSGPRLSLSLGACAGNEAA